MYAKNAHAKLNNTAAKGLTRLATGLTHVPAGLRVKTHIKAGPTCTSCAQ